MQNHSLIKSDSSENGAALWLFLCSFLDFINLTGIGFVVLGFTIKLVLCACHDIWVEIGKPSSFQCLLRIFDLINQESYVLGIIAHLISFKKLGDVKLFRKWDDLVLLELHEGVHQVVLWHIFSHIADTRRDRQGPADLLEPFILIFKRCSITESENNRHVILEL